MKDPVRLLDGGGSAQQRDLLRAGASEEPPADGAARVAAALGVAFVASASASTTASASTSTAASSASTAPAATSASVGAGVAMKWLLLSGAGLVLAAGGVAGYRLSASSPGHPPTAEAGAHNASARENAAARDTAAVRENAAARDTAARENAAVRAGEQPAAKTPGNAPASSPVERAGARSIAGEIAALDRARERLGASDARGTLLALERYRSAYPRGVLRQEAAALQIEALWRTGARARARQLAREFARDNPRSPHRERMLTLTGGNAR